MSMAEAQLLRKVLAKEDDLKVLLKEGFDPTILTYPYDKAFDTLIDFYRKHNELPSPKRLKHLCADHGDILLAENAVAGVTVYWEQVIRAAKKDELSRALTEVQLSYNDDKLADDKFIEFAIKRLQETSDKFSLRGGSVTLADCGMALLEDFKLAKDGKMPGIPIPEELKILTGSIRKLQKSHITTIIARTGVGKTWLSLILAVHAARHGHPVLIASMEMERLDLSRRLVAIALNLNFDAIKNGYLDGNDLDLYRETLKSMKKSDGLWNNIIIMEPGEIRSVHSVENRAHTCGADLIVADAFYMYPGPQEKRWERVEANLADVRHLSLISPRHWILTAQFNRSAKGVKTSDEFAVGASDSFNQDSNNIIYLIQRRQDKRQHSVIIQLGKGRDCEVQVPWLHNWDFKEMNYKAAGMYSPGGGSSASAVNTEAL